MSSPPNHVCEGHVGSKNKVSLSLSQGCVKGMWTPPQPINKEVLLFPQSLNKDDGDGGDGGETRASNLT